MPTNAYIVRGRVQGVSFRYYTTRTAQRLGITGTVRNLENGDVEVIAQGDEERLRQLEEFLEQGPPAASVRSVEKSTLEGGQAFRTFDIVY